MSNELDLYSTAAQVIPLFLGFVAFDLKVFARGESASREWQSSQIATTLTALLLIALLVLGEVAAIAVLAQGAASDGAHSAVLSALFAGGLLLVVGVVELTLRPLSGEGSRAVPIASNAIVVLAVAGWLLLA